MNILDPQGPIGAAEKTILIDSLGIMLAIVVPTIVAIAPLCVLVSRREYAGALPSGMGLFRPY